MGSGESHLNVSLIVRGTVKDSVYSPQLWKSKKVKAVMSTYQPNSLTTGQPNWCMTDIPITSWCIFGATCCMYIILAAAVANYVAIPLVNFEIDTWHWPVNNLWNVVWFHCRFLFCFRHSMLCSLIHRHCFLFQLDLSSWIDVIVWIVAGNRAWEPRRFRAGFIRAQRWMFFHTVRAGRYPWPQHETQDWRSGHLSPGGRCTVSTRGH